MTEPTDEPTNRTSSATTTSGSKSQEDGDRVAPADWREHAEALTFLTRLADALFQHPTPDRIMEIVRRMLGEHLKASRVFVAEASEDAQFVTVAHTWSVPGLRELAGTYRLADYGKKISDDYRAGRTHIRCNTEREYQAGPELDNVRAVQAIATLDVPVVVDGRFRAVLIVHQSTPRNWTDAEVALVRQVADRMVAEIERARVEQQLQESEARFRELADAMPQIVFTARPDGTTDYFNKRWYDYTGLPRAEGEPGWAGVHYPPHQPQIVKEFFDSVRGGRGYEGEQLYRRASDNTFRWHLVRMEPVRDASGQIIRWFGTSTDIHDKKMAAEALREGREQLSIALAAGQLGTWQVDLGTLEMTCSDTCKANYGRPLERPFTYEELWQICHPDDRERTQAAVRHAIETGNDYVSEYRVFWPDGVEHWVAARGRVTYGNDGKPQRISGVSQNISDRKRADEQRERMLAAESAARAEAEVASRMKDEFLATLSHELRTPLNAILGWAQIIQRNKQLPDEIRISIDTITRNARSQAQIIEDLLDMSRIISGKVRLDVQRVDLSTIVQSAIETARPTAEAKNVRLRSVIDPLQGVVVSGDPNRLQQVLWNLLTNAIKFTPKGGLIQVLLERVNSHLEISVIDTGDGISPDFLPYVFDRFRQADATTTRRHGGLGLGLSIVKQLVELHGGAVRVKSNGAGQGSSFIVALPLTAAHPDDESDVERRHPRTQASDRHVSDSCVEVKGVRVLVVDDEVDARLLVKRLLEDCDAIVKTAGSSDEAIGLMQQEHFDVLVSDIGMPDADGYSLIRRVRLLSDEQGGNIAAIALTAYARAEDRIKAIASGFQMHVAKPVEPAELITMVASAAGRTGRRS